MCIRDRIKIGHLSADGTPGTFRMDMTYHDNQLSTYENAKDSDCLLYTSVVFAPAQFAETLQQRVVVTPDGCGGVMRRSGDIGVGVRDEGVVAGVERVVNGRGFRRQIPGR